MLAQRDEGSLVKKGGGSSEGIGGAGTAYGDWQKPEISTKLEDADTTWEGG